MVTLGGREVIDIEVDVNGSSYELEDFYFSSAVYKDTGEPLTDDELDELYYEYPELIEDARTDRLIAAAEGMSDYDY